MIDAKTRARFIVKTLPTGVHGCWLWRGYKTRNGYGRFWMDGRTQPAHRVSYELHVGPIPDGLHIDHLCRNRMCVNPEHLEPVTLAENNRRGAAVITHCPQGHEYAGDNLYIGRDGKRYCRTCHRERQRAYRARKRMEANNGL